MDSSPKPLTDEEPLPVTSQHGTDARETPASKERKTLPEPLRDLLDGPIDEKLQLLKHHADMARLLAEEIPEENVEALAGERHSRSCPSGLSLWKVPAQMGMQSRIDPDRRGEGPDRDSPASRYSSASR